MQLAAMAVTNAVVSRSSPFHVMICFATRGAPVSQPAAPRVLTTAPAGYTNAGRPATRTTEAGRRNTPARQAATTNAVATPPSPARQIGRIAVRDAQRLSRLDTRLPAGTHRITSTVRHVPTSTC